MGKLSHYLRFFSFLAMAFLSLNGSVATADRSLAHSILAEVAQRLHLERKITCDSIFLSERVTRLGPSRWAKSIDPFTLIEISETTQLALRVEPLLCGSSNDSGISVGAVLPSKMPARDAIQAIQEFLDANPESNVIIEHNQLSSLICPGANRQDVVNLLVNLVEALQITLNVQDP